MKTAEGASEAHPTDAAPPNRVVVTDWTFPDVAAEAAVAERLNADFDTYQCQTPEDVTNAVRGAKVVLVQFAPLQIESIAALAPQATIIRYGVGFDNVDVGAARAAGHEVCYIPDYCVEEVATHSSAMTLALLRKLPRVDSMVRSGDWRPVAGMLPTPPNENTVIGMIGLGRIGRQALTYLKSFGFKFMIYDPFADEADIAALGGTLCSLDAVLRQSDALILLAPSNDQTRGLINSATISNMKSSAIIVNCSRGDLIVEADIAKAIAEKRLGGAGLDVFAAEPLAQDSALRDIENVLLSPHAAWYSDTAMSRLQMLASEEMERALTGRPPRCPVPTIA